MVIEAGALGDRYTLTERIAVGGMGAVYRATDNRLGRTVALKLLKEGLAHDPRFVERFRREARSAAGLTHPNIAGVFDYGEEGGQHFIVMELADGRDLSRLLVDDGPLAPERAFKIAAAIADALGHAHRMGVVHRDVKPANVIVDAHDKVKVTDFGIARAAGDSTLTQTGTILGTAFYLSPEQASGENVGPYSDVYSLGVVLYEMLTGAVPFTADSPVSVAMKHLNEDFPPPSWLKPDLQPEVDELVISATSKSPAARPADGTEVAARIRRVMDASRPVAAAQAAASVATDETAVLPAPEEAVAPETVGARFEPAAEGPPALWELPGPPLPWGRILRLAFLGLGGLVVLMLAVGALTGGDGEAPGDGSRAQPAAEEDGGDPAEVAAIVIPQDVIGRDVKDVEKALEAAGLAVETVPRESDQYEKHQVVATDPEPGSEVRPGATVTLYESDGPTDEDDDEGDEDEGRGPPDEPPGQAKKDEGDD